MARPLPEPTLFIDECLGSVDVPEALRAIGAHVELHHDHFSPGTHDEDWILDVARRGWVVLTKDQHIRKRQLEREALLAGMVPAFVFTGGGIKGDEMARAIVRAYPRMRKILRDYAPPFVAAINVSGNVTFLSPAVRHAAKKRES